MVVLLGIAAGAIALWLPQILQVSEWTVMTDELQTVEQGLALWSGNPGDIDRYPSGSTILGYAALLAPLYGLMSTTAAFTVAHILNLLLMVSAAVPAYLLTKRVVGGRFPAYLVAALTVAVPWIAQATNLLAEPLAYPVFVWATFAILVAVERGGARAELLALAAVVVAFFVEPQLGVLGPVLVAAVLLQELRFPGGEEEVRGNTWARARVTVHGLLRRHPVVVVIAVLGLAVLALDRGSGLLGSYSVTISGDLFPDGFRPAFYLTTSRIAAGVGFLPLVFGAAWVVGSFVRPPDRRAHAAAVVLGLTVAGLLVVVTSFGLRFAPDPQERYSFYIAPLLFVATACFFLRPARGVPGVLAAAVGGLAIVWMIRQTTYGGGSELFASPATAFHQVYIGRSAELGSWFGMESLAAGDVAAAVALVVLVAAGVAVVAHAGRTAFVVLGALLLVFGILQTRYVLDEVTAVHDARVQEVLGDREAAQRRWVDRAVPDDASVAVAPSSFGLLRGTEIFRADYEQTVWWDVQFWNGSIDRVFSYRGNTTHTPFGREELRLNERTGELGGPRDPPRWLVTGEQAIDLQPQGTAVAAAGKTVLWRLDAGFRAAWASIDVAQDGWTGDGQPGRQAGVIRIYEDNAARARRVSVTVSGNDRGKVPLRLIGGRRVVHGVAVTETPRTVATTVCVPSDDARDVEITSGGGELTPGRIVGVRVLDVRVEALERSCPTEPE